jgi:pimeloyl-ACP methyl ester carboxylesterase
MPYTTVGAERVFYTYHRSTVDEAPHLILVHGAGGNHRHWGSQVRTIATATTYALDLPGHGRSGGRGRSSIADYAAFLVGFMDALQLEQAIVAGHSMGGATAMTLALQHPQRAAGLVLVGTGARLRVLPAILEGTLSHFQDTVELICRYAYAPEADRQLVRRGQREMLQVTPQTIHDDFAACDSFDIMGQVEGIGCPTLVICGMEDRLTPLKYSQYLMDRIAGAELTLVPAAGHMVMVEKPELVAKAIGSALTRWQR